jgi:hypothetical protein
MGNCIGPKMAIFGANFEKSPLLYIREYELNKRQVTEVQTLRYIFALNEIGQSKKSFEIIQELPVQNVIHFYSVSLYVYLAIYFEIREIVYLRMAINTAVSLGDEFIRFGAKNAAAEKYFYAAIMSLFDTKVEQSEAYYKKSRELSIYGEDNRPERLFGRFYDIPIVAVRKNALNVLI